MMYLQSFFKSNGSSLQGVMLRDDFIRFLFSRDHSAHKVVENMLEGDQHGSGEECEDTTECLRGGDGETGSWWREGENWMSSCDISRWNHQHGRLDVGGEVVGIVVVTFRFLT